MSEMVNNEYSNSFSWIRNEELHHDEPNGCDFLKLDCGIWGWKLKWKFY